MKFYFDGACGPKNDGTGDMGIGVVLYHNVQNVKLFEKALHVPYTAKYETLNYGRTSFQYKDTSNNLAEHLALFHVLRKLYSLNVPNKLVKVHIFGDSKMVINQMKGYFKINDGNPYSQVAKRNKFILDNHLNDHNIIFEWIPRENNSAADELSKLGCVKKLSFEKTHLEKSFSLVQTYANP